jgi:predicted RNA-binding protein associated with RNAse of E/G family
VTYGGFSQSKQMSNDIIVRKLDFDGEEKIRYAGRMLERTASSVVLEAFFSRERMELGYVTLKPGDRFVERFYADRWYNVFAVYDVDDGRLKGWYCNITRPALIADGQVSAVDLALDVWIAPDGSALVLDEDEFAALPLASEEKAAARAALDGLRSLAAARAGPFAAA